MNIAPAAHATASSWRTETLVVANRDATPRNIVDGNLATGWQTDPEATGPQWVQLDFTRPWKTHFKWTRLVTHWSAVPRAYRWDVSHDGIHWQRLVERTPGAMSDSVAVRGEGEFVRVVVSEGEQAALLEVEAYAGSGGRGQLPPPTIEVEGNRVSISWEPARAQNAALYRVTRDSGFNLESEGGRASVTLLLAEGKMTEVQDRIEFPPSLVEFTHRWTVEAFAPDGSRIGEPAVSDLLRIDKRTASPFALRGVVEGYYGPSYSAGEREDFVRFIGNRGGNFYLYGPKLDPYHRDRWREPYPAEFVTEFAALVATGQNHGVQVAWSLSPGIDYTGSEADRAAAIQKYLTMYDAGVRWFALFMDDIPVDGNATAAAQHVGLANAIFNALQARDPEVKFIFVPTVYFGNRSSMEADERAYLETLADLAPAVYVAWTGTGVFVHTMSREQMEPIASLVKHPLILWDNLPVADFFLGRRLNLGPVSGRAPDLAAAPATGAAAVYGYLANPMWLPAANRLPLATVLDYLLDPAGYDPDASLAGQISREAPSELRDVFARWVEAFRTNPLVGAQESSATLVVSAARQALDKNQSPPTEFLAHAAALYVMEPALSQLYFTDLAGDLIAPAHDAALLGEAALARVQAWSTADAREREERLQHSNQLLTQTQGWLVAEGGDQALLEDFGPELRLANAPRLAGALPHTMPVGRKKTVRFDLGGGTGTLFGLPGATLENGVVTWTPTKVGKYRWVLVSDNGTARNVAYGEVAVTQKPAVKEDGCRSAGAGSFTWLLLVALAGGRRIRKSCFTGTRFFR